MLFHQMMFQMLNDMRVVVVECPFGTEASELLVVPGTRCCGDVLVAVVVKDLDGVLADGRCASPDQDGRICIVWHPALWLGVVGELETKIDGCGVEGGDEVVGKGDGFLEGETFW